jgi:TolB protein
MFSVRSGAHLSHPRSSSRRPAVASAGERSIVGGFASLATLVLLVLIAPVGCDGRANDGQDTASNTADAGESPPEAPSAAAEYAEGAPPGVTATLAFQSDREGRTKIFLLDVATGRITQLTHGVDHHDQEPAWSPDGRRIAFSTTRFDSRTFDIAVMSADGSDVRRVTMDMAWDRDPEWMPDGVSLVFTREENGPSAIYRVWPADGRVERVSRTDDRALMPAVSPDGKRVAYTVGTVDGFQIVVTDLRSGVERQITRVPEGAIRPSWSPDGQQLFFTRLGLGPSYVETASSEIEGSRPVVSDPAHRLDDARVANDARWMVLALRPTPDPREFWKLAIVDLTSPAAIHLLTRGRGNDRSPSWKP